MNKLFLFICLLAVVSLQANPGPGPKDRSSKRFAKFITAESLKKHLYTFAGKEMMGRGTFTEGQKRAAQYIINHFKQIGLQPGVGDGWEQYFVSGRHKDSIKNSIITPEQATKTYVSSNVLGVIEGTDKKDEYVFITSHYDHLGMRNDSTIYYGADDDGSGTVTVLEIAEAFAKAKEAGYGPRRTIIFMTFSGEEMGLVGSKYYTDHPIYPLKQTVVDLNIDMVGRIGHEYTKNKDKDSLNYLYVIGDNMLSSELRPISEKANEKNTRLKLDYKYNDPNDPNRFYYRSDHYMFAKNNIPVIFYFNGTHKDYHALTDTPDKIEYDLMAERAKLIFHTAWSIANRDERLIVDRTEGKKKAPRTFGATSAPGD